MTIMAMPSTEQRLNNLQMRRAPDFSGEYFSRRVQDDLRRWKGVIEQNSLQVD